MESASKVGLDAVDNHPLGRLSLGRSLASEAAVRRFQRWFGEERLAWSEAMSLDPLLPQRLHPPNYPGMKAWKRRREVLADAGRQLRAFRGVV